MFNPYDTTIKEAADAYATEMCRLFPDHKDEFHVFRFRAMNVLGHFVKNYYLVNRKHLGQVIDNSQNDNTKMETLTEVFGEDCLDDCYMFYHNIFPYNKK